MYFALAQIEPNCLIVTHKLMMMGLQIALPIAIWQLYVVQCLHLHFFNNNNNMLMMLLLRLFSGSDQMIWLSGHPHWIMHDASPRICGWLLHLWKHTSANACEKRLYALMLPHSNNASWLACWLPPLPYNDELPNSTLMWRATAEKSKKKKTQKATVIKTMKT